LYAHFRSLECVVGIFIEGYYVPDEGYSRNVPDEGYYVPDEGYYVPDEGYSRNVSCALSLISTFYWLSNISILSVPDEGYSILSVFFHLCVQNFNDITTCEFTIYYNTNLDIKLSVHDAGITFIRYAQYGITFIRYAQYGITFIRYAQYHRRYISFYICCSTLDTLILTCL
jgi:hypothetical protein